MAKKEKTGIEILESAEALKQEFGKAEGFLKKNQMLFTYVGGGILAIIVGIIGYNLWSKSQEEEAQVAMISATNAFIADSTNQALNGTGGNEGLLSIASNYGSTKAGKLAELMAGSILLKQGKYDQAIEHLKGFSASDLILQGRAYALIGDAYLEKKNAEEAISYYKKAADYKPSKYTTPTYLMKLATAYETIKDNKGALDAYRQIVEKYPDAGEATNAKKYKSKLEGIVGE